MNMLRKDIWHEWEPRMILPLFKGVENIVDFIANDDLNQIPFKQALKPMYFFIKKQRGFSTTAKAYSDFVFRKKINYRGIFLDRAGNFLFEEKFEGKFGPGDLF